MNINFGSHRNIHYYNLPLVQLRQCLTGSPNQSIVHIRFVNRIVSKPKIATSALEMALDALDALMLDNIERCRTSSSSGLNAGA
jgi:hypothetical protein